MYSVSALSSTSISKHYKKLRSVTGKKLEICCSIPLNYIVYGKAK